MASIVVRTSSDGLAFMAREWLPAGVLYLRTEEAAEPGAERTVQIVLPDGREASLVGRVAEVTRDARGCRIELRLNRDSMNAMSLALIHAAVGPENLPSPIMGRADEVEALATFPDGGVDAGSILETSEPFEIMREAEEQEDAVAKATIAPRAAPEPRGRRIPAPPPPPVPAPRIPPPPTRPLAPPARQAPPPPPVRPVAPPQQPPAPKAPRGAHSRVAQQSKLMAKQLEMAFAEIAAMGLKGERRRSATLRRAADLLRPIDRAELLADLLPRVLLILPASGPAERRELENDLCEMLPRRALIQACLELAKHAPEKAGSGQDVESRLDAATHVVAATAALHMKTLDPEMLELLQALAGQGAALAQRAPPAVQEWIASAAYLRSTRREAEAALAPLETLRTQDRYATELVAAERAMSILRQERRWAPLAPIVELLVRHRDGPPGAFDERRWLAAGALERFFSGNVPADLVRAFTEAGAQMRDDLGRVLMAEGDRAPVMLLEILKRSSDAAMRKAAAPLLASQAQAARRAIVAGLVDPEAEWFVVCNLLALLGEIGKDADLPAISIYREHAHDQVRRAALEALAALGGKRAEAALLKGLDDRSRIVQCRALLLLGQIRSTSGMTLGYVRDLLKDVEAPDEDEDLVCVAIEALARIGNIQMPDRGGTAEELLVKTLERTRRSGLAKMLHGTAGGLWSRVPVRKALAGALGRIGLERAEEILKKIAYDDDDPIQKEAEQAIFQIADRRKTEHGLE
ncbi:MAG: hypothetical protein HYY06_20610 [Deltaproteobacteria bacterium]|nr:hypothetical protein [Deltaproteobacteria bacterium]